MDLKILFFFIYSVSAHESDGTWSYDGLTGAGPEHWADHYPLCGGTSQSPIDIPTDPVYDDSLTDFQFNGYESLGEDDLEISNVGWTVKVVIKPERVGNAYFTGGGFQGKYVASQLHIHWGVDDSVGSDHTFKGNHYPAELHIAHYKEEYGSISEALKHNDGATILAFPFKISDDDNEDLVPFFNALGNIPYKGDKGPFGFGLDMFIVSDTSEFYIYNGSFTHPPCLEVITWTFFKHAHKASSSQIQKLRQLYDSDRNAAEPRHIINNGRPTQPLGNRSVIASFQTDSSDSDDDDDSSGGDD